MFYDGSGLLAVMPRPAAGERLRLDMNHLAEIGFDTVVSLLTNVEEQQLDLAEECAVVEVCGMDFRSFPIIDKGVPVDVPAFYQLVCDLALLIEEKQRVIVHCWAGIGRSGLLASAVLIKLGRNPDMVFDEASTARGETISETAEQRAWFVNQLLPNFDSLNR